ncbi:Cell division protein ZapA [Ruminococcaceae bacterium YRB3002]|nr:Cell division protein ZapA [Ruminococcaceae bacterium YRB3002]
MKKTNTSILGKYSDTNLGKRKGKDVPPMVSYEQRFKGESMAKGVTEPAKPMTLDEKIARKNGDKTSEEDKEDPVAKRVSVSIGDNTYLLGANGDVSEARIRKVAALADEIYKETKENNPYIATNKTAILSLIECCDRYLTLKDQLSDMRTELMYYKQKDQYNEEKTRPEPTPMEKLSMGADGDIND